MSRVSRQYTYLFELSNYFVHDNSWELVLSFTLGLFNSWNLVLCIEYLLSWVGELKIESHDKLYSMTEGTLTTTMTQRSKGLTS